jgi:hypothetical protein
MRRIITLLLFVLTLVSPLSASTPNVFPSMNGWKQGGEIQTFSPDNLYEYINGAADLYLDYKFQELKVAEYQGEQKSSITIEIYRFPTSVHAFGIYSQERPANFNVLDIGLQGYRDEEGLYFLAANYYVIITASKIQPNHEEVLLTLADKVAKNLGEKGSWPRILFTFPPERKIKFSEKFIAKNFLGYPFFHSGFTALYDFTGKKTQIFVIEGHDLNDARQMMQKYLQQVGKAPAELKEGLYQIADPYHGKVDLAWKGIYIFGILNLDDPAISLEYLKLFQSRLLGEK